MSEYLTRATGALDTVVAARVALGRDLDALAADASVPAAPRRRAHEALERLDTGATALDRTFTHLATTALDIVDVQVRLEGEAASVAAALKALGEAVESSPALRDQLMTPVTTLEEAVSSLASAIFPSAVDGLSRVNRALWDFRGPVWMEYTRTLADEVGRGRLTTTQVGRIEQTAAGIRAKFEAVDALLNELAGSPFHDRAAIITTVAAARKNLTRALTEARSKASDAYKPFHRVLGRAQRVAERVLKDLGRIRVPAFPPPDALAEARSCVDPAYYATLGGAERFALFNILSGLRAVEAPGASAASLLDAALVQRVFAAFPDRIYVEATPALLATLDRLREAGSFASAPAALHRFRDGSLKQREFRKGNLQFSYERAGRLVRVDIDIDLYRGPVSHLFGEVLINHLTGSTTCQYDVRQVLDQRGVAPLDGFAIVEPGV